MLFLQLAGCVSAHDTRTFLDLVIFTRVTTVTDFFFLLRLIYIYTCSHVVLYCLFCFKSCYAQILFQFISPCVHVYARTTILHELHRTIKRVRVVYILYILWKYVRCVVRSKLAIYSGISSTIHIIILLLLLLLQFAQLLFEMYFTTVFSVMAYAK